GKKGILTEGFTKLKELEDEAKKEFAAKLNAQKEIFNEAYLAKFKDLENLALEERMKQDALNFNYFDESITTGALHPVMSTMDKII
ncbi:phenylalanine--tRNA ligase subunit alpha, partial [Aliarcobacter butzleri]